MPPFVCEVFVLFNDKLLLHRSASFRFTWFSKSWKHSSWNQTGKTDVKMYNDAEN